ncbi:hypothetical protein PENTCL1PPCAC_2410, partial [Pristionchus entomophagus]
IDIRVEIGYQMSFSSPHTPSTETPLATRVALENGLRSKLTGMENAIARVASVKARLRKNAEQARRDLSLTISAQMEALRFREQQLIRELEDAVQRKESVLASQQEKLNLHIGACQQSLESLRRASPTCTQKDVDVQEMLFRLSAVDVEPRANDYVALQVDTVSMRGVISDWGKIVNDGDERRETRKVGRTVCVEMEEYDDSPLAHKSLMWNTHRKRGEEIKRDGGRTDNVGSAVRDWLANTRPSAQQVLTADIGRVMEDVEQKSSGTSCDSTFEVIDPDTVLTAALKCSSRPLSDWLPPVVERDLTEYWGSLNLDPPQFPPSRIPEKEFPSLSGLRSHPSLFAPTDCSSIFSHPSHLSPSHLSSPPPSAIPSMAYQFESVIGRLMKSNDQEWLAPSCSSSSLPPSSVPSSSPSNPSNTPLMMSHAEAIEKLTRETERMRMEADSQLSSSADFVHPTSTVYSGAPPEFSDQWQRVFGRGNETGDKWLEAKSS